MKVVFDLTTKTVQRTRQSKQGTEDLHASYVQGQVDLALKLLKEKMDSMVQSVLTGETTPGGHGEPLCLGNQETNSNN